jgi:hypothetical protein
MSVGVTIILKRSGSLWRRQARKWPFPSDLAIKKKIWRYVETGCRIPEGCNEWVVIRNICYSLGFTITAAIFLVRGREVVERSYETIFWFRGEVDVQDSLLFAELFVPYTVHTGTTDHSPEDQVQNRGYPFRLVKERRKGNLELRIVLRAFGALSVFQSPDQPWHPPSQGSYPGAKATCELLRSLSPGF